MKGEQHLVAFPAEVEQAAGALQRVDQERSSTYRELYAVIFMIRAFVDKLKGEWVRIQCDNRSLYYVAKKGSCRDLATHKLLVDLFCLCEVNNIRWDLVWVPRELNRLADLLSKHVDPDDWSISPLFFKVIQARLGRFEFDRFASEQTALLPRYSALYWAPGVEYVDCFSRSWAGLCV